MYTISKNVELGFLDITISAFWDVEQVVRYAADLRQAIAAFPDIGRPPASLYNFTDAAIQSQDVVEQMRAMAASPELTGRRVALYTERGLARLQARRVARASDGMRVFETRTAALAWVTGE